MSEHFEIITEAQSEDGTRVQVLAFEQLRGSSDLRTAETLYFAQHSGMRLKLVKISLANNNVRTEPGALYYMRGDLEIKASSGGGLLKGLSRKMMSGESFFVNEIHGSGEVFLEPTFGHFLLHSIDEAQGALIVDNGLFYAGTSGLSVSATMQKNVSSAMFGGEGLFQTKIAGKGIAIIFSPVPQEEIIRIDLRGEKLSVDGNFALMRTEGVSFKAEKSSKSWLATSVSGEGLLQTFSGTGSVWIAPSQGVYSKISNEDGIRELALPPGAMSTNVDSTRKPKA